MPGKNKQMKKFLKDWLKVAARSLQRMARDEHAENKLDRQLQILLSMHFRELAASGRSLPTFGEVEFSTCSQNGEDGILLFIFSIIGTTNKRVVEAAAGDGIECNAANLILNHGWEGLLLDGNAALIERGKAFYGQRNNAWRLRRLPPALIHAWIDRDNIDELIGSHGMAGPIDLLSLDMDGIDFWIWKAIQSAQPRVVVVEYNNRWSSDQSLTVPYARDFVGKGASVDGEGYFGASLKAFTCLAKEKGYRLIGANSPNTNAFFMKDDVGVDNFPEVSVESCLASAYAIHQHATKYPLIKNLPVIEV